MKTVKTIALAAVGLIGSAIAFSLEFSAFAAGTELNDSIEVKVPGYGKVVFTEAPNNLGSPATDLEITDEYAPFKGIGFEAGEQVVVTFEGAQPTNIAFAFAGVGAGESFNPTAPNLPDDGTRNIAFSGDGAAIIAVSFDAVPEPSSTLLVALSALGLLGRRRR